MPNFKPEMDTFTNSREQERLLDVRSKERKISADVGLLLPVSAQQVGRRLFGLIKTERPTRQGVRWSEFASYKLRGVPEDRAMGVFLSSFGSHSATLFTRAVVIDLETGLETPHGPIQPRAVITRDGSDAYYGDSPIVAINSNHHSFELDSMPITTREQFVGKVASAVVLITSVTPSLEQSA